MAKDRKKPAECSCIEDVRYGIDTIDREIIDLLAERFEFVKEVVKYKAPTPESIIADQRRRDVLKCRRQWAQEKGLDPEVIEEVYDRLIRYFIAEEMKIKNI